MLYEESTSSQRIGWLFLSYASWFSQQLRDVKIEDESYHIGVTILHAVKLRDVRTSRVASVSLLFSRATWTGCIYLVYWLFGGLNITAAVVDHSLTVGLYYGSTCEVTAISIILVGLLTFTI